MEKIILLLLSYLLGSIPTAYIIGRMKGIDIRNHGSGNIGATNVYRVLGWKLGIITFLIDVIKGFLPTYISMKITQNPYITISCGISAIIGHVFTIFLNFKGGKGVATSTGVFLAIATYQVIISLLIFIIIVRIWGFVSLATLISTLFFTIISFISNIRIEFKYFTAFTAVIIFLTHLPNIKRLLTGKELKYNR